MEEKELLEKIRENVISGRIDQEDEGLEGDMEGQPGVTELVEQAIENKISADKILSEAINPGMEEVGKRYENGDFLIPDMLAAAECVGEATKILKPLLLENAAEGKGKFILATVEGDLHDIGKNIVSTIVTGAGFDITDLGVGVKAEKIVEAVKNSGAKYLGLSALLTTTMGRMQEVIEMLEKEGLRQQVKVLVGGAPVTAEYAKKIGADIYCDDAFDAIHKLEKT
ncbi:MAG TPA: corrinoid protein [Spirochaetota bacterium]|nr:corrinoid protein [Spirochaetota bacterium]